MKVHNKINASRLVDYVYKFDVVICSTVSALNAANTGGGTFHLLNEYQLHVTFKFYS